MTLDKEPDEVVPDESLALVERPLLARRRLLILPEVEFDKATYEAPELFEDPETWVVNYDDALRSSMPSLGRLVRRRVLRPNQVFLLSPYDDTYVAAHDAEEAFSLRKFEAFFTRLCYLLGAKQVTAKRDDIGTTTHAQEAGLGGGRGAVKVDATVSRDLREKVAQQLRMTTEFKPGPPQVEAAIELLEAHGLTDDSTMRGLVELFRHGEPRVRSQELVLNVTSEASREISAVANLKVPAVLTVSASFKDLRTTVQELLVELKAVF